jgi:hypothetical protein
MNSLEINKAINKLRPGAQYSFSNGDYSTIEWTVLEGTAPTLKEIEDAIIQIKVDEIAKAELDAAAKATLLDRLGITADEAKLLLG